MIELLRLKMKVLAQRSGSRSLDLRGLKDDRAVLGGDCFNRVLGKYPSTKHGHRVVVTVLVVRDFLPQPRLAITALFTSRYAVRLHPLLSLNSQPSLNSQTCTNRDWISSNRWSLPSRAGQPALSTVGIAELLH